MFKEGIHIEEVPAEYLSHKESYELAVKKACHLFKLLRQLQEEGNSGMDNFKYVIKSLILADLRVDLRPVGRMTL